MFKSILVPLDDSEVGEAVLPYVAELVSNLQSGAKVEVTLLQVVTLLTYYVVAGEATAPIPYTAEEMERIKKRVADNLNNLGEDLRNKGATVKTMVRTGSVAEEIAKAASEINADLIAMSTHGRSGFSRLTLGCIADEVLRVGHVPLLLVRAPKGAHSSSAEST
jgi:nucleotide-binding universal stress UspA family protein